MEYIPLTDQSIALVGPNGVGKSSLMQALKRALRGIRSESHEPMEITLDVSLPLNLEEWLQNNDDPGLLKAIRNQLIIKTESYLDPEEELTTEQFSYMMKSLWDTLIIESISDTSRRMYASTVKEFDNDSFLLDVKKIREDIQKLNNESFQIKEELMAEYQKITKHEQSIQDKLTSAYNPLEFGLNFLLTPVGTSKNPKWKIETVVNANFKLEDFHNSFRNLASLLTWPKPLQEAVHHRGYFGREFNDPRDGNIQKIYAQFIDNQVNFGLNLGVTEQSIGFLVVDPDELDSQTLKSETMDFFENFFNFSESPSLHKAIRYINSLGSEGKKFNVFEETESFKPFDENGEISKDFSDFLKKISELATSFFQQFLPGAPKIVFATNRQEHWVSKGVVRLEVLDGYQFSELNRLSETQLRWAKLSIYFAIMQFRNSILFIDEPEKGIHRKVEKTLLDIFDDSSAYIPRFVATHSAEIIKHSDFSILMTKNREGFRELSRISGSIASKLNHLQITKEEYFQTKKLLVLTEGKMDKAMIDGFALDRLDYENIEVLTGFGLDSWGAYLDSEYLKKSSGTKLVFWADSIDMFKLARLELEVKSKNLQNKEIAHFFRENLASVINEKWSMTQISILAAILSESFINKTNKVKVVSTGDYDCIMWLSPSILGIKRFSSWSEIKQEFEKLPKDNYKLSRGKRFKQFINRLLREQGIVSGLEIDRLENLCKEMSVSGQIPSKIEGILGEIISFANS